MDMLQDLKTYGFDHKFNITMETSWSKQKHLFILAKENMEGTQDA